MFTFTLVIIENTYDEEQNVYLLNIDWEHTQRLKKKSKQKNKKEVKSFQKCHKSPESIENESENKQSTKLEFLHKFKSVECFRDNILSAS